MPNGTVAARDEHHGEHHPALQHHFQDLEQQHEASTLGMWLFLVTEVMFFGGLILAYTLYRIWYPTAWALGSMEAKSAVDALAASLGDANSEIRLRAAWAIGNTEPKQAPKALINMLNDPEPRVRQLAAWALYQIEDPAAIPALDAALRRESSKDLQIAYIKALAAVGEKSVEALKGLLESKDPEIKAIAIRALAGGNATGPWPWPWPEPRPFP